MDEIEFRRRVYANPQSPEQELLDAASDNPDYRKFLIRLRNWILTLAMQ